MVVSKYDNYPIVFFLVGTALNRSGLWMLLILAS